MTLQELEDEVEQFQIDERWEPVEVSRWWNQYYGLNHDDDRRRACEGLLQRAGRVV